MICSLNPTLHFLNIYVLFEKLLELKILTKTKKIIFLSFFPEREFLVFSLSTFVLYSHMSVYSNTCSLRVSLTVFLQSKIKLFYFMFGQGGTFC